MTTPTWVSLLADDGLVSAKELGEWFCASPQTIRNHVKAKTFPAPAYLCRKNKGKASHKWLVRDIRQWLKTSVVAEAQPMRAIPHNKIVPNKTTIHCATCAALVTDVCRATKYCKACSVEATKLAHDRAVKKAYGFREPVQRKGRPHGPAKRKYNLP